MKNYKVDDQSPVLSISTGSDVPRLTWAIFGRRKEVRYRSVLSFFVALHHYQKGRTYFIYCLEKVLILTFIYRAYKVI